MKKLSVCSALIGCLLLAGELQAQTIAGRVTAGPYTVRNSSAFETPKKFAIRDPLTFSDGVLQISMRDMEFNFQWFSNDLKKVKENTIDVSSKFSKTSGIWGFIKLKTKVYCLAREVFHETENEGLAALELDPQALDVKGNAKSLYRSSGKVQMGIHSVSVSDDKSKFMCRYPLVNRERNDKLNKEVVGIEVFDENLTSLWGGEIEMPYTEARMENLGYTLTNDGKVCLLAKVYEGEDRRDGAKDKTKPNYHFEVLIYQKGSKNAKIIEIKLDTYFNREAYIYQDKAGNIAIAGFYGHGAGAGVDGAYLLTLDVEKATVSKLSGGFYEIPEEFIKSFMSKRQLKKAAKKEEKDDDFDLELANLVVRDIYNTPDGSTKIVSEIYYMVEHTTTDSKGNTHTHYSYVYKDIVIMNIKGGKLDWIKKIPKYTETGNNTDLLSINTMVTGNELHIFWKDKPENSNVPEGEKLAKFGGGNGMLRACTVSAGGELKKYDVVDLEQYDMRFSVRLFTDNGNNTLINTERSRKQNVIFAIDVKP